MTDEQILAEAQEAVTKVLGALNIHRVVCVDDNYKDEAPVEEIIASLRDIENTQKKEIFPELKDGVIEDSDLLSKKVRQI